MTTRDEIRRAAERLAVDPDDPKARAVMLSALRRTEGAASTPAVADFRAACEVIDGWLARRWPGEWRRCTAPGRATGAIGVTWMTRGDTYLLDLLIEAEGVVMYGRHIMDAPPTTTERALDDLTPSAVRAALGAVWVEMGWRGQRALQRPEDDDR